MEHVIDNLLKDFERGKMSRRQLIQSLALAALASPAAASAQTAAAASASPGPAPWKTVALDHISYAVTDYKRSAAFYKDLMGWEIKNDDGQRQCTMRIGNVGDIIIRNNRQPPATNGGAAKEQPGQSDRPPVTGVINHVSWGIEPWNTEKVEAELKRRGLNPRPDMQGSDFKSYHVLDPDGWDLQISNQNGKG
jgi:catechol 2,3-dioxygenase-like lactoylglutathione lyase family enzyme